MDWLEKVRNLLTILRSSAHVCGAYLCGHSHLVLLELRIHFLELCSVCALRTSLPTSILCLHFHNVQSLSTRALSLSLFSISECLPLRVIASTVDPAGRSTPSFRVCAQPAALPFTSPSSETSVAKPGSVPIPCMPSPQILVMYPRLLLPRRDSCRRCTRTGAVAVSSLLHKKFIPLSVKCRRFPVLTP